MQSFGKMLKALPHHSRERSKSRERVKTPTSDTPLESQTSGTTVFRKKWNFAPATTKTIVTIKPLDADGSGHGHRVHISCEKTQASEIVEISNPFDSALGEDIRWFIEDFGRIDPLNRAKALRIRTTLRKACDEIIRSLQLDTIIASLTRDPRVLTPTIYIEVEGELSVVNSIHNIPWEALEHYSLWPDGILFDIENAKRLGTEICVRRKATTTPKKPKRMSGHKDENGVYRFETSFSIGTIKDNFPTFNILLICARDLNDKDDWDSHFQIARSLVAALNGIDESVHFHLEICRPATFDVFQTFLSRQAKGFWHVVHLDLPSQNNKLHFCSSYTTAMDPIPTYLVAEAIHKHEVGTVFLTCEELESESTQTQSHAVSSSFVAEGIPVVIHAPFKLPKLYLTLMCSAYYQSLLLIHRKGPAYAAHVARRAMQNQEINHLGRHQIPIKNTAEGLSLFVFDNSTPNNLDTATFCYPVTEKTPKRWGSVPYQDFWLAGRDLDIVKIEHQLLSRRGMTNIMWLTGRKAIGKTFLLNYLTYWWGITKLIHSSVYVDLSASMDTLSGILEQLSNLLPSFGLGDAPNEKHLIELRSPGDIKRTKVYKDLVKTLRGCRIFAYFDNVDHWRPGALNKTAHNEEMWKQQRQLFLDFVEEIRGGLSLIILVCSYNTRAIGGRSNTVFELKPLETKDVELVYPIEKWDDWVPGTGSISENQSSAQQETARQICDFHDAIVECSRGAIGARQQFIYNLPFEPEQRTRDIFVLLHLNQAGTTGPYNMETSPVAAFVEQMYDLIVRDREDMDDKSPDANPNLLPLMFAMSTFFDRIPKDIDFYLVLLCYYGLFSHSWILPGENYFDHSTELLDRVLSPDDFPNEMASIKDSPVCREWNNMIKTFLRYDYISLDSSRPEEYYILAPAITFGMRKIVYASEGQLTTPILPLSIRLAGQDYYIHRSITLNYSEDLSSDCRLMLEKHTLWSQTMSLLLDDFPRKSAVFLARGPLASFLAPQMTNMVLSSGDQRVLLYLTHCIETFFDQVLVSKDLAADPIYLDSDIMFEAWKLVCNSAKHRSIYHNTISDLPDSFDEAVLFMRKCKAFGQRYERSRWVRNGMHLWEQSLVNTEEIRHQLVGMGVIKDDGGENDREAPPAYEEEGQSSIM